VEIPHRLLHKLSTVCFVVRKLPHIFDRGAVKSAYLAYFHSLIRYTIIFYGNSTNGNTVLLLRKRFIRVMMGIDQRRS